MPIDQAADNHSPPNHLIVTGGARRRFRLESPSIRALVALV